MTKAESFAMQYGYYDKEKKRACCVGYNAGYKQAEKDLALTWEDIRTITKILEEIVQEDILVEFYNGDAISCYKEVLRRFQNTKKYED